MERETNKRTARNPYLLAETRKRVGLTDGDVRLPLRIQNSQQPTTALGEKLEGGGNEKKEPREKRNAEKQRGSNSSSKVNASMSPRQRKINL